MKIAIVDDDLLFAESFSETVCSKWPGSYTGPFVFSSIEEYVKSAEVFDFTFLDIEMPGISGIEFARQTGKNNTEIIFVTNRDDLVYEAYNSTNALGFIRKSCLEADLAAVLNRIELNLRQELCFVLRTGDSVTKLRYSSILYIEKVSHDIVIYTADRSYTKRATLVETEQELAPYGFVKTHAGYIVNLAFVQHISNNGALLSNGKTIPVSRKNLKYVKDKFLERSVMLYE